MLRPTLAMVGYVEAACVFERPTPSFPLTALLESELNNCEPIVAVSNQTLIADAANYHHALDVLEEMHADLAPLLNFDLALMRSSPGADPLNAQASESWTLVTRRPRLTR